MFMKKITALIITVLMFGVILMGCMGKSIDTEKAIKEAQENNTLVEANTEFAFEIFKQLNEEDANESIFISPLSIATALTMTYNGARSTTKDAMAQALQYRGMDIEALNEGYKYLLQYLQHADSKITLDINNSIWMREGEKINEDFIDINKNTFDAYIKAMDFSKQGAADEINDWIDNATNGKITEMIDPPISQQIVMFLINAIYFKGDWTEPFDEKRTFDTVFNTESGQTNDIKMMRRTGKVMYGQGEDYKAVRLPYGKEQMAMYAILPAEDIKINDFISTLNTQKWQDIKNNLSEVNDVTLQIPRFELEYGIKQLNDSLTAIGMGEAFSGGADFSGICPGIFIDEVLHKAVIEVNEEGSEAAAATVVVMKESAVLDPITFIADRPFVFIIADDATDTILFMGKVMELE